MLSKVITLSEVVTLSKNIRLIRLITSVSLVTLLSLISIMSMITSVSLMVGFNRHDDHFSKLDPISKNSTGDTDILRLLQSLQPEKNSLDVSASVLRRLK